MENDIKKTYIQNVVNSLRDKVFGKITIRFTDERGGDEIIYDECNLIVDLKNMDFCFKWVCKEDIYNMLHKYPNPYEKIVSEFMKAYKYEIMNRYIK